MELWCFSKRATAQPKIIFKLHRNKIHKRLPQSKTCFCVALQTTVATPVPFKVRQQLRQTNNQTPSNQNLKQLMFRAYPVNVNYIH